MKNVYSVAQVNAYIKNMFTQDFMLNRIYLKGEVSNCKYHTSGHIYFTLKDESGVMSCVMFANQRKGLAFRMDNGQKVIILGSINVYERDGRYQMYAQEIMLDGAGLLYEKFEALKRELEEMGMFAPEYKQPVPRFAKAVGIVTAPTGAAIQDIMNVAARRNPYVQLVLYPALVQGEGAAASICAGIETLAEAGVDVIIAGRGGGSIEDLWAFNEETVARAIFDCPVPIISAVGHETDTTIADYVADLRAPTPSAAAELAVFEWDSFRSELLGIEQYMRMRMQEKVDYVRNRRETYQTRLKYLSPQNKLREKRQYTADLEDSIRRAMGQKLDRKRHTMELLAEKFHGLSPLRKLQQGYSFVAAEDGKAVTSVKQVKAKDQLKIHVTDGVIYSQVTDVEGES